MEVEVDDVKQKDDEVMALGAPALLCFELFKFGRENHLEFGNVTSLTGLHHDTPGAIPRLLRTGEC